MAHADIQSAFHYRLRYLKHAHYLWSGKQTNLELSVAPLSSGIDEDCQRFHGKVSTRVSAL